VAGREIYQAYIGSSANPGLRDFAIAALIVADRQVVDRVSLDINPTSRQILENLVQLGYLEKLIHAGARIHQAGCNGCIGMGQAPATGKISLRTVPRNFPGRSGTKEDQVYLCSPETAAASALTGVITDPRSSVRPTRNTPSRLPSRSTPRCWCRRCRRTSERRSNWKRAPTSSPARFHPPAGNPERTRAAQNGRQRLDR
jgi:aconitase A